MCINRFFMSTDGGPTSTVNYSEVERAMLGYRGRRAKRHLCKKLNSIFYM